MILFTMVSYLFWLADLHSLMPHLYSERRPSVLQRQSFQRLFSKNDRKQREYFKNFIFLSSKTKGRRLFQQMCVLTAFCAR